MGVEFRGLGELNRRRESGRGRVETNILLWDEMR